MSRNSLILGKSRTSLKKSKRYFWRESHFLKVLPSTLLLERICLHFWCALQTKFPLSSVVSLVAVKPYQFSSCIHIWEDKILMILSSRSFQSSTSWAIRDLNPQLQKVFRRCLIKLKEFCVNQMILMWELWCSLMKLVWLNCQEITHWRCCTVYWSLYQEAFRKRLLL